MSIIYLPNRTIQVPTSNRRSLCEYDTTPVTATLTYPKMCHQFALVVCSEQFWGFHGSTEHELDVA